MNKKRKIIKIFILSIVSLFLVLGLIFLIKYVRVKFARIEVVLTEDLTANFLDKKKISDYIVDINGTILDDQKIDTTKIGKQTVSFKFKNDDGIKVPYEYEIEVKDTVEPVIWLNSSYSIYKGNDVDIAANVLCGDNEDNNPNCFIEGEYNYDEVGEYPLVFKAIDRSGNVATKNFTLYVLEPKKNSNSKPNNSSKTSTLFTDVVSNYKNENTKIGIDVSGWQGDIDFEKIKNAGVEFIIIKVGGTKGIDGEYYVDSKFVQNITRANEYGIDVGVYFYSYANSVDLARKDANFLLQQIKDYKISLPIAFDWENWSNFNDYNLSFFALTNMASTFLDIIKNAGYEGMLYSSKNYLERLWLPLEYPTWLAHYTKQTNYQGSYKFWQICDDGEIDGIDGAVDIDIMYLD